MKLNWNVMDSVYKKNKNKTQCRKAKKLETGEIVHATNIENNTVHNQVQPHK